jgi:hypothetical protein
MYWCLAQICRFSAKPGSFSVLISTIEPVPACDRGSRKIQLFCRQMKNLRRQTIIGVLNCAAKGNSPLAGPAELNYDGSAALFSNVMSSATDSAFIFSII